SRPIYDRVTKVELGNLEGGYHLLDTGSKNGKLYSISCNLHLGLLVVLLAAGGKLEVTPKNQDGQPLKTTVEALAMPRSATPDLLPPRGRIDPSSATMKKDGKQEIKEWQAIMDYLRALPKKPGSSLPIIPMNERTTEVRAINLSPT